MRFLSCVLGASVLLGAGLLLGCGEQPGKPMRNMEVGKGEEQEGPKQGKKSQGMEPNMPAAPPLPGKNK